MNSKSKEKVKKLNMGIEGLDDILGGGLPANHVYLVEGNPGSGKTTLALQYLLEGAKRGESGLYVTLSESESELIEVADSHGWDLGDINIHELSVSEDILMPDGQYTFFHPSEVELSETTASLVDQVENISPKRVVFDSLSEMRLLARDPLRYRRQILGLKQFFLGKKCTVILIDDLTSGEADMQPQSLAHGVITMEKKIPLYGTERRRIKISKLRGVSFRSGYHDFNLITGGIKVFPRLIAHEHKKNFDFKVISSGNKALDEASGGGLVKGSSNLISGPAGVGKSTLATQFALGMAAKQLRSSFFIFDEVKHTLIERSRGLGMDLTESMRNNLMTIKQVDPAEISPGEFIDQVRQEVTKGSELIIIDSLNGYLLSMPDEKYLVSQLHELLSYLSQLGVTSILISSQHGVLGSNSNVDSLNVSYLSDTWTHLRYFESEGRIRKAISIIKKRYGIHEDSIREYALGSDGIQIGEPLHEFSGILTGVPTYHGAQKDLI